MFEPTKISPDSKEDPFTTYRLRVLKERLINFVHRGEVTRLDQEDIDFVYQI